MGLDMYLYKKTFLYTGEWVREEERCDVVVTQGGEPHPFINPKKIKEIVEEVGYWRKANQIHRWFVENIQDGNDNCGDYYVSAHQLEELLKICKQVEADHSLAESLLPSASGFFFGATDYDEWYYEDIKNTIKILEDALIDGDDFYYSSSR